MLWIKIKAYIYAIHSGSITKTSFRWNAKVVKQYLIGSVSKYSETRFRIIAKKQRRTTLPCSLYVYILAIKAHNTQRMRSSDGI